MALNFFREHCSNVYRLLYILFAKNNPMFMGKISILSTKQTAKQHMKHEHQNYAENYHVFESVG